MLNLPPRVFLSPLASSNHIPPSPLSYLSGHFTRLVTATTATTTVAHLSLSPPLHAHLHLHLLFVTCRRVPFRPLNTTSIVALFDVGPLSMSDPAYVFPPYREPRITLSRTPSPVQEGPDTLDARVPGVELIVSKLPRSTVLSATEHLRATLGEYAQRHPSDPLVPLRIVAGDERNPVDYVFLSVDPTVTQEP